MGHSLGGGVASLICFLLRNDPALRQQLPPALDITCIGYGIPPVLTLDLATSCCSYVTSIVHNVRGFGLFLLQLSQFVWVDVLLI